MKRVGQVLLFVVIFIVVGIGIIVGGFYFMVKSSHSIEDLSASVDGKVVDTRNASGANGGEAVSITYEYEYDGHRYRAQQSEDNARSDDIPKGATILLCVDPDKPEHVAKHRGRCGEKVYAPSTTAERID